MHDSSENATSLIRHSGLRVTAPRRAVLRWLSTHPHATADDVQQGVSDAFGSISKQAVYDVLAAFTEADLVRRIEPAGHPARFEWARGDDHHHLVCRDCGAIADFDCDSGDSVRVALPDEQTSELHGFVIDEAEIVFWGRCAACRSESRSENTA